ncbi:MAG: Rid family hydrolase [Planctomycetota bacterium]
MTKVRERKESRARVDGSSPRTAAECMEMEALGISLDDPDLAAARESILQEPQVARRVVRSPDILNEATDYFPIPSSFSRGLRVAMGAGVDILYLSGTASIDDHGKTVHAGDLRAQTWRTFRNLTRLLESEGASWHDIVRTSCYLRDIERDYDEFNRVRTSFFRAMRLDPVPASTGIQARLCRSDLLVEIEAIAAVKSED